MHWQQRAIITGKLATRQEVEAWKQRAMRAETQTDKLLEADIQRKLPDSEKTGSNVALGVAGAFLLVPWFFMDFSKADQVEIEALRRRYNSLVIISADKDCGFENKAIPEFTKPAVETK